MTDLASHLCRLFVVLAAAYIALPVAAQPAADASYAGTLPCADCSGRQVVLALFGDGTYRMRTRCLDAGPGVDDAVHEIGRRAADGPGRRVLRSATRERFYAVQADGALRLPDTRGQATASEHIVGDALHLRNAAGRVRAEALYLR